MFEGAEACTVKLQFLCICTGVKLNWTTKTYAGDLIRWKNPASPAPLTTEVKEDTNWSFLMDILGHITLYICKFPLTCNNTEYWLRISPWIFQSYTEKDMIVKQIKESQRIFKHQQVQFKPRQYSYPHKHAVALAKLLVSLYSQVYTLYSNKYQIGIFLSPAIKDET